MPKRENTPNHAERSVESHRLRFDVDAADTAVNETHFLPGQMIHERYRVISEIGRGGMGSVYKVEQIFLSQHFALKTIIPERVTEQTLARFRKEARAASSLSHPGLVKVIDFGIENEHPWFVMDLLDGQSLSDHIKRKGPLDYEKALAIFAQIAEALAYAHDSGVIHRDLKPNNIMLIKPDQSGQLCKIVDFGIAKLVNSEDTNALTQTGEIFGSPLYMSPEQCLGQVVDPRSDMYSFGCVLFEALTGVPPFNGDSSLAIMLKHQSEVPPTMKSVGARKTFNDDIENLVAKLLRKQASDRYESLYFVATDLNRIARGQTIPTITNEALPRTSSAHSQNEVIKTSLITVALLAAGFLLGQSGRLFAPPKQADREALVSDTTKTIFEDELGRYIVDHLHHGEKYSSIHDMQRNFGFPFEFGKIKFKKPPDTTPLANNQTEVKAYGKVNMTQFRPFELVLGEPILLKPELLLGFRNDEINALNVSGIVKTQHVFSNIFKEAKEWIYLDTLLLNGSFIEVSNVPFITQLKNIKTLEAEGTQLNGQHLAEMIEGLKKLETIALSNSLDIAPALEKLKRNNNVSTLAISECRLEDNFLKMLATMPGLKVLRMNGNPAVTGKGLSTLQQMPNLISIEIADCSIKPADMAILDEFPALRRIAVGGKWTTFERAEAQSLLTRGQKLDFSKIPAR